MVPAPAFHLVAGTEKTGYPGTGINGEPGKNHDPVLPVCCSGERLRRILPVTRTPQISESARLRALLQPRCFHCHHGHHGPDRRTGMKNKVIALCGIDTDVGKSVVTGLLAAFLTGQGKKVITQKPVQTGCTGQPGDILLHRRLMDAAWNDYDERGLTCSYCLPFAGSPHLAARLAGCRIEAAEISRASQILAAEHDCLLIEGAGGLLVPLDNELLQIDYFQDCGYPILLVTTPRLGSINHTLLSLEAIRKRRVRLLGLVYNLYGDNPVEIVRDSRRVMKRALGNYGFSCPIVLLPDYRESRAVNWRPVVDALV